MGLRSAFLISELGKLNVSYERSNNPGAIYAKIDG